MYEERRRLTATNVPGRKVIVNSAMAFIAELSLLAAEAISRESAAIDWLAMLSRCAIRFHIYSASQMLSLGGGQGCERTDLQHYLAATPRPLSIYTLL